MSKAEDIISKIQRADEVEILEFDFEPCFEYMRKMEAALKEIKERFQSKFDLHKDDCFAYNTAKQALDIHEPLCPYCNSQLVSGFAVHSVKCCAFSGEAKSKQRGGCKALDKVIQKYRRQGCDDSAR